MAGPATASSASSISITPLSGSQSGSRALCHLLEFDDAKILLDCGINASREEFTVQSSSSAGSSKKSVRLDQEREEELEKERMEYLDRLKILAPQLTLVLLSSPTIEALGLLPYLVSKLRLACPIYATFQCRTLGQLTLEEWIEARAAEEEQFPRSTGSSSYFPPPATPLTAHGPTKSPGVPPQMPSTPASHAKAAAGEPRRADDAAWRVTKQDVQLSFSRITPVVYTQVVRLAGRANSPFSLLAHPAGGTLGATLWSLRSATTDSLLYAPTFNHVKERTLDPAAFLTKGAEGRMEVNEAMRRVGILVIGAERSKVTAVKAKERDQRLLDIITTTLAQHRGQILLPTDSAGRFIEILVLLEQHWAYSKLSDKACPLCLLAKNGEETMFSIRRLAESLGGQLGADEAERERILKFRNVKVFSSAEQLLARYGPDHPKLVLCSPSSLSYGPSRHLLVTVFLSSPRSLILLTSPGAPGSLSSHLFQLWNQRQSTPSMYGSGKVGDVVDFAKPEAGTLTSSAPTVRLRMRSKVILQGEELMSFLEEQRVQKERDQKARAMQERNRRMMEADDANASSDSDDSDDSDDEEKAGVATVAAIANDDTAEAAERRRQEAETDAILGDGGPDHESGGAAKRHKGPQGVGIGPAAFAEPGSGPAASSAGGRRGAGGAMARYGAQATAGSGGGAWDEFFDDIKASQLGGFDIYVRHHSKAFGGAGRDDAGQGAGTQGRADSQPASKYRMFPFFERRRKVDGYGEFIDIEGWKTRNKAPEEIEAAALAAAEGSAAEADALGKRKRAQEEADEAARAEPPHKFVVEEIVVTIGCKVLVVDMEGKADGRALRSILPLIEPKRLVLVNGNEEATKDLASALQSATIAPKDIITPEVGQVTKIADVTKSFSVRLDDSLMTALALRKIDEYEVVPIKAVIGSSDESTIPVLVPGLGLSSAASGEGDDIGRGGADMGTDTDMSDACEPSMPLLRAPHFIGDIKLALLKANLSAKSVPVSFSKGSLVCGPVKPLVSAPKATQPKTASRLAKLTGMAGRPSPTPEREEDAPLDTSGGRVVVRKEGNQLVLEGAPGDTFYAVRSAIYDLHAVAS